MVSYILFMVRVCDTLSCKWVPEFWRNMLPCVFSCEDGGRVFFWNIIYTDCMSLQPRRPQCE